MDLKKASGYYFNLHTLLQKLYEAYMALLKTAEAKQTILVDNGSYEALGDITAREEAESDVAVALERERMEVVKDIASLYKADAEGLTVSRIAELAGEPLGEMLRADARKLMQCLQALREQNAMNRQLIEMKLSYGAFMMDALAHQAEGPTNLYGANGQEDAYEGDIHRILDSEV